MERCNKCNKPVDGSLLSAYDEVFCEDCWDKYVCTKKGKVEYLIGICLKDYPATEFDDEFLLEVVESWNENKEILCEIMHEGLFHICDIRAQVLAKL